MKVLFLNCEGMGLDIHLPSLGGMPLIHALTVRNLGVILDTTLSMEVQVIKSAFYHLWLAQR